MATSPTVLVDNSSSPTSAAIAPPGVAAKIPLVPILIAVVAGVAIATVAAGGIVYYLARTGRLPGQATAKSVPEAIPVTTRAIVLEPFLVNLANRGGSSYLRLALTIRVAEPDDKKNAKASEEKKQSGKGSDESDASVRDTVLTVLGRQDADDLLAADGKDHLKSALKSALAERNPDLKVTDVFFTDFLVQR